MNVLFLCTGNSARSILAEVLTNELGGAAFSAHSAGSMPANQVNPGAIAKLETAGHSTNGLSSKSWDVFSEPGAPHFDIVVTVCDNAAGETCPVWYGSPVTVHWGIPDPAGLDDPDATREAFDTAYARLRRRVEGMIGLPLASMTADERRTALQAVHDNAGDV